MERRRRGRGRGTIGGRRWRGGGEGSFSSVLTEGKNRGEEVEEEPKDNPEDDLRST